MMLKHIEMIITAGKMKTSNLNNHNSDFFAHL